MNYIIVSVHSFRETERERESSGDSLLAFWIHVQPVGFGCGLSFNANGVSTILLVSALLHYFWVWGTLITLHSSSAYALFSSFHSMICVLLCQVFSFFYFFYHLCTIHLYIFVSNLLIYSPAHLNQSRNITYSLFRSWLLCVDQFLTSNVPEGLQPQQGNHLKIWLLLITAR